MSTTGNYTQDNTIYVPFAYTPSIVQPPVTVDNTIYQPAVLETLSGTVEIIEFAPKSIPPSLARSLYQIQSLHPTTTPQPPPVL